MSEGPPDRGDGGGAAWTVSAVWVRLHVLETSTGAKLRLIIAEGFLP